MKSLYNKKCLEQDEVVKNFKIRKFFNLWYKVKQAREQEEEEKLLKQQQEKKMLKKQQEKLKQQEEVKKQQEDFAKINYQKRFQHLNSFHKLLQTGYLHDSIS